MGGAWWLVLPWATFAAWFGVRVLQGGGQRVAQAEPLWSRLVWQLPFHAAVLLSVYPPLFARFERQLWPSTPLAWALGFVVEAAGVALAIAGRETLGALWTGSVTIVESHELVTRGPYALVRHPIYSGLTIAFVGLLLGLGQLRCVVALVLVICCFLRKIQLEERLLVGHFGAQYEGYRKQVRALIPFVL